MYDKSYISLQVRFGPQPRTINNGGFSSMNEWMRRLVNGIYCCPVSTSTRIFIHKELFRYVTSDVNRLSCPNVK